MKITLLFCLATFSAFAQDSLKVVNPISPDTVDVLREVAISPDGAMRSVRSLPYYVVPVTDTRLKEPSMGMSVLNTLRGQVPGFFISPQFVTTNPLEYSTLLSVDGAPAFSEMASLASFNTFDYELPTVLTGNASMYYGMYGNGDVVLLKRRTGEGFDHGTFTFNTYNTSATTPIDDRFGLFKGDRRGLNRLSNSVAFAKDFGAVDLRVSGNYTFSPEYADYGSSQFPFPRQTRITDMNFKINTGWSISSKLRARLILEKNSAAMKHRIIRFANDIEKYEQSSENTRANLNLEYNATSWLRLSSLLQKSWIDREEQMFPGAPSREYKHDRDLVNLFANFDKQLTTTLGLSASTGIQRDKGVGIFPYYINSQMNTLGVRFKDQLFVDGTLRLDNSDIDRERNNKVTWSAGAAWIFSEIMKENHIFSFGKLRASIGRLDYSTIQYYPQVFPDGFGRLPGNYTNSGNRVLRYDLGTDLFFWDGRIQFTFNAKRDAYFNPDPVTETTENGFIQWTHVDHTRVYTDQRQVALGLYLNGKKTLFSKLLFNEIQYKRRTPPGKIRSIVAGYRFYASFLQTAMIRKARVNVLLEAYSLYGEKVEAWGLRELSIAYPFMEPFAQRRSVDAPVVSLIFRNFMDGDEDLYTTNYMTRSISLGLTFSL